MLMTITNPRARLLIAAELDAGNEIHAIECEIANPIPQSTLYVSGGISCTPHEYEPYTESVDLWFMPRPISAREQRMAERKVEREIKRKREVNRPLNLDRCYHAFLMFLNPRYMDTIDTASAWSGYLDYFFKGNARRRGIE